MEKNIKKRNKTWFVRSFLESLSYIRVCRNYIYFMICLFLFFIFLGAFIPAPQFLIDMIREFARKLIEQTSNLNLIQLIYFIFKNNITASFLGLFFGIFLGIFPLILAMVNGYVLGYISKITVQSSSILDLWRLFPHGIFELPAVLISLGLGLKLGFSVINNLEIFKNKKDYWNSLIKEIKLCVKTFIFIVLILLVFAAIIEGILIRLIS